MCIMCILCTSSLAKWKKFMFTKHAMLTALCDFYLTIKQRLSMKLYKKYNAPMTHISFAIINRYFIKIPVQPILFITPINLQYTKVTFRHWNSNIYRVKIKNSRRTNRKCDIAPRNFACSHVYYTPHSPPCQYRVGRQRWREYMKGVFKATTEL